ncbi:hypothetical protein IPM62_02140 [Candidatus Woesebacteria bacterium]|nr:MAG: hypothetical protein IPM62_02140 [Candidatus Woesebacteria bacterium]
MYSDSPKVPYSFVKILFIYLEGIFTSLLFLILVGLTYVVLTGNEMENLILLWISFTPWLARELRNSYTFDATDLVAFLLVWGAVISVFSELVLRKTRLQKYIPIILFVFGTIFFPTTLIVLSLRFGIIFALLFLGVPFVIYTFCMLMLLVFAVARRRRVQNKAVEKVISLESQIPSTNESKLEADSTNAPDSQLTRHWD